MNDAHHMQPRQGSTAKTKPRFAADRILLVTVILLQAVIVYKLFAPDKAQTPPPTTSAFPGQVLHTPTAAQQIVAASTPTRHHDAMRLTPMGDIDDCADAELRALVQDLMRIRDRGTANPRLSRMLERDLVEAQWVHRQMDSVFNSVLHDFQQFESLLNFDEGWPALVPSPTLDMRDLENHYLVIFSLPGISTDDVQLQLDGRILTLICGADASPGAFYQGRVQLPGDIDESRETQARLTNGVLKVFLPKASPKSASPHIQDEAAAGPQKEIL